MLKYIKTNKKEIVLQTLIMICIYICVRYIYPELFPYYANAAFTVKYNISKISIGCFVAVIILYFNILEYRDFKITKRISCIISVFLNCLYFLPGIFCNMVYERVDIYIIVYSAYAISYNILAMFSYKLVKVKRIPVFFIRSNFFYLLVALSMILVSLYLTGLNIEIANVFSSEDVYEKRLSRNDIAYSNYLLWYFLIFGSSILPTWTIISLHNNEKINVFLYTVSIIFMYSVCFNRQFIFTFGFAILFYLARKLKDYILIIIALMWMTPCIEYMLNNFYPWANILRRLSLVPNLDSYFHYDFFSVNEPDYLRQAYGFYLSRFDILSPYHDKIASMIGQFYFNTPIAANTGMLGGDFANYGYISVLIGPFLHVLSFYVLDCFFTHKYTQEVLTVTALVIVFSVTNSETWFELIIVPSWIAIYYISLFFLPRPKEDNV